MGEIFIDYNALEDSVQQARKARNEAQDYADELKRRVASPIAGLPGPDPQRYASAAASLAQQKIDTLINVTISYLDDYQARFNAFLDDAKAGDASASNQISSIAEKYVEKRTWYQKAGDWLYNTFCVDLAGANAITRTISSWIKKSADWVGDKLELAYDWFRYGDGRYVWNIAKSVITAVAAVGGAIAAIATAVAAVVAAPVTGGASLAIFILCIGAFASSIGAVITVVNSAVSTFSNAKAIQLSGNLLNEDDGDVGAARYYGNVEKLSDHWAKKDMGSAQDNANYETAGTVIDTVKTVADTTAVVSNIASLGIKNDFRFSNPGERIKGYDFSYSNIKHNIMHDMGYDMASKKPTWDSFNPGKGLFAEGYGKDKFTFYTNSGVKTLPQPFIDIFRGAKSTKTITSTAEGIYTLDKYFSKTAPSYSDAAEATKSVVDIFSNAKFFSFTDDYGQKVAKVITDWVSLATK